MKGYFGTSYSEEGSLTHYGVKGMKWGRASLPEERWHTHVCWKEKV